MNVIFKFFVMASASALLVGRVCAQSEPPPLAGAFGAANSAINYGVMDRYIGGSALNCEAKTRWKTHMAKRGDCRLTALDAPAGKERRAARDRCEAMYPSMESPNYRR